MNQTLTAAYRRDIDGLRAIAVVSVVVFHFGYLPNGYLGVDVFFAISGFLITGILYREVLQQRFSLIQFYLRRTRRIIPLVLFVSLIALLVGFFVMLPDDLENLGQSVITTNFFSNNLLLWFTTGNYWNIANNYKPLMHTWSLGVEEQFYLLYPLLFLLMGKRTKKILVPALIVLTVMSLCFFLLPARDVSKFYLIQFRFFELSLGGLAAIFFREKKINGRFSFLLVLLLLVIMSNIVAMSPAVKLLLTVIASVGLLITPEKDRFSAWLLENPLMTGIGKISFSLYMWHQLVLAFTRYVITDTFTYGQVAVMLLLIVVLSVFSYFLVEQPFRNKQKIRTKWLLVITGFFCVLTSSASLYIYSINGVVKDVPELDKYYGKETKLGRKDETNILYNSRIYEYDKPFSDATKTKVLVVGDSFARDWSNVLLESRYGSGIELSYMAPLPSDHNIAEVNERFNKAKYIFFSDITKEDLSNLMQAYSIDTSKVWIVGTKNFGVYNGVFYNHKRDTGYCTQRVAIDTAYTNRNKRLSLQWGSKYIDLIGKVIDGEGAVPVFTPQCKFISQDAHHLTTNGAKYFAELISKDSLFR